MSDPKPQWPLPFDIVEELQRYSEHPSKSVSITFKRGELPSAVNFCLNTTEYLPNVPLELRRLVVPCCISRGVEILKENSDIRELIPTQKPARRALRWERHKDALRIPLVRHL